MKNKLMGVLALASCVVLSGCGNNKEDVKIVIKDLPTNLVEGDKIDLKNYIEVSGGNGGYSINFDDESFAKITKDSETQITLNEYGNVNFTVSYSGKNQDATLIVGSEFLDNFVKGIQNAGYDYGCIYFDDYDDPHWENYGEKFIVDYYYSDESFGGYLEDNGTVYSFEETWDDVGEPVFSFAITGMEPTYISDYSKPLDLPTSGYQVSKESYEGESYSVLTIKENEDGIVRNIFLDFFGFDPDSLDEILEEYNLEISSFQVIENPIEFTDGDVAMSYDCYAMAVDNDKTSPTFGEEFYLSDTILILDKEYLFSDDVKDFIESGEHPHSNGELNVEAISAAVSNHNYQIKYSGNWYKCSVSSDGSKLIRGSAVNENPFVEDWDEDSDMISDHFNAFGEFNAYVSPTKTLVEVPNDNAYGLVENPATDNSAWDYSYDPVTSSYKTGSQDKSDTGFELWHEANWDAFYNYEFLAGVELEENMTVYSGMFINSMVKEGNTVTYNLSSKTCYGLFASLFYYSVYDGEIPAYDDWKPSSFTTFSAVASFIFGVELVGGLYLSDVFDVKIVETYQEDNLVGLYVEFVWTDAIETAKGYEYYQYVLSTDIDFTVCNMPSFDVEFPVVE